MAHPGPNNYGNYGATAPNTSTKPEFEIVSMFFDSLGSFVRELNMRPVKIPYQKTEFVKGMFHTDYYDINNRKFSIQDESDDATTFILSFGGRGPSFPDIFNTFVQKNIDQSIIIFAFDGAFDNDSFHDYVSYIISLSKDKYGNRNEDMEVGNVGGAAIGGAGSGASMRRRKEKTTTIQIKICGIRTNIPSTNLMTKSFVKTFYTLNTDPRSSFAYFADPRNCKVSKPYELTLPQMYEWIRMFRELIISIGITRKKVLVHHDAWYDSNGQISPGIPIRRYIQLGRNFEQLCIIPTLLLNNISSDKLFIIRYVNEKHVIYNFLSPDAILRYQDIETLRKNATTTGFKEGVLDETVFNAKAKGLRITTFSLNEEEGEYDSDGNNNAAARGGAGAGGASGSNGGAYTRRRGRNRRKVSRRRR